MDTLVKADKLVKTFGDFVAVDGISLDVKAGEVLGFLGPNGAGKTTTMKMLTGFLEPVSGSAEICGISVTTGSVAARRRVGYLPEGAPLYADMTAREFLSFVAESHGFTGATIQQRVEDASAAVDLGRVMHQRIETLSKGFKRRVGLAAAILHGPDVLILDEPTDGLDPNQKFEVRKLIHQMSEGRAIIISTHILEEVEALCSRAVVINRGAVVADGTPSELKARSRYRGAVTLLVAPEQAPAIKAFADTSAHIVAVDDISEGALRRLTLLPANDTQLPELVAAEADKVGWVIDQFMVESGRLDDVFRDLTRGMAA